MAQDTQEQLQAIMSKNEVMQSARHAMTFWAKMGEAHPKMKQPSVALGFIGCFLVWKDETSPHFLEIELRADGTVIWFYKNAVTNFQAYAEHCCQDYTITPEWVAILKHFEDTHEAI